MEQKKTAPSERKHVTIVFTDLSGYTAMTERLDPEEVRSVLGSVFKKIARIVEGYDGFIERYIGDSVMAVFGIPRTHEDDPVRAIHAALQIHEAVNRMNAWISQKTGCAICMHTGINTGLVLTGNVSREDGSHGLTGLDLNIAARLEGLAGYRQIQDGAGVQKTDQGYGPVVDLQPVQPVRAEHGVRHVSGSAEKLCPDQGNR
ncbi:MAG: adenylate/guanylate cyclase domain-containing protein [Desulfobacteraceae bacterium]|nr:adenylate/guanylate cyclase domain-containing protein [Desulfobacteraceae bacterium]